MKTKALLIFFILLVVQVFASADEILIVDVRRNITLADEDSVYKDFYINAGEGSGLKKNLVVFVKRKIAVKDQAAKSIGNFETIVGQIRIIHVDGKVAVGREYKLQPRDSEPMLEQIGMMTGDRIDLAGSFVDSAKPTNIKHKTAEIKPVPAPALEEKKTAVLQVEVIENVKNPAPTAPTTEKEREPATQKPSAPQALPEI